ncbi:MAG: metallophosphoesterase [Spirochaetes bacterium]|nr:metallophosphoesterase [Spirochaetota bacterium]
MRIIFITDIHGSFNQAAALLYETVADVYIIGGDLIDIPFYSINTAIHYHDLQTFLHSLRKKMNKEDMLLEDFVDNLLDFPNVPEEIIEKGSDYQELTVRARRVMQQKYKVLENMISFKSKALVFAIPGNYDMDLKYTSMHERDLHMHWHNIGGLKIAGYGGADVWTAGIPERYIVKYNVGIGISDHNNEMYTFFKAVKPDIIATHQPAHGIHDRIARIGPSGSPALRSYCENNPVKLCLTGHIHNDWGFKAVEGCVYLNPSNFGDAMTIQGEVSEGGFFFQVELEDTIPVKINLRKLVDDRIHDIAEYRQEDGRWREDIIDLERYEARRLGRNYDTLVQRYSHIPEIELFKEIKNFFRLFRTQETEDRLDELDNAIELLKGKFDDIAMDIVGSVNMGLSQESSDIDVVLYLRCGQNCRDMMEQCDYYKSARALIDTIIGDKYRFEIIDCIDLNVVEQSIITKNYECEVTQRFVAYRSICRPVNYKAIAPIEDILNEDIEFRREMEGSIRSYFRIFATTSQHMRSFDKYESRLKSIGIKLPESIRDKIREYLQVARKNRYDDFLNSD